jgi:hypothetical protein
MCAAAFGLALLGLTFAPNARADEWNRKTVVTFNEPVEIPGQVLLPGTYVFKLLDSQSDRDIVQVFNKDETHLYATILAIPDYRMRPPNKPIIKFEERTASSPEAIKAWFYPGDNYGQEFVYPQPRAIELAATNKQSVPAMPAPSKPVPSVQEMRQAPVARVSPPTQIAKATPPPAAPAPAAAAPVRHLPRTASDLPLVGLMGLLSLAAALGLRLVSKRLA